VLPRVCKKLCGVSPREQSIWMAIHGRRFSIRGQPDSLFGNSPNCVILCRSERLQGFIRRDNGLTDSPGDFRPGRTWHSGRPQGGPLRFRAFLPITPLSASEKLRPRLAEISAGIATFTVIFRQASRARTRCFFFAIRHCPGKHAHWTPSSRKLNSRAPARCLTKAICESWRAMDTSRQANPLKSAS